MFEDDGVTQFRRIPINALTKLRNRSARMFMRLIS